jgi:cell division protein FtsW (lipid II flippase)/cell division protein FtsI/penicillin-binding protein 2
VATSAVVLLGIGLAYNGQTSEFDTARRGLSTRRIVNLATLESAQDLAPALRSFNDAAKREAVAKEVFRRIGPGQNAVSLTHVGALTTLTMPVPLFTSADVAAIKQGLVVRTPEDYRRQILIAISLFMAAFWLAHLVRSMGSSTGDPIVLPVTHLLTGIGLAIMLALRDPLRDTVPAAVYAGGVAAGCALFTAIGFVDFEDPRLRRAVLPPLVVAVLLATALLTFGTGPAGSGAKVNLLGVQPVEAIRLLTAFSLAAYFARRWQFLRDFSAAVGPSRRRWHHLRVPRWKDVRPLAVTIGTLLALFFLQKDLGPALVLSCVFLGLYGMARGRGALVVCGFVTLAAGFAAGYALGIPSTVTRRVAMWLNPWENGISGGDQIAHALWAFSSGAAWGVGPGTGDPQLIPAGHTDLVLAAIGEELGLVGVATVAGLFALLVWRILRIARRAPGDYTAFLVAGLGLALIVQGLVIAGGILGLLPLAGVVTPFLSYGRSAMLSNFAALGVCCAVARRSGEVRQPFSAPIRAIGWTLTYAGVMVVCSAAAVQTFRADAIAARGNLTRQADGLYRYQYNPRLVAAARRIVRGTVFDRNGLPLATSRLEELQPFTEQFTKLGIVLPDRCSDVARCYPLGGLAFHVLGESSHQTNWAARNASFIEREFDARLRGFHDYGELLPLVRHRGRQAHTDVRRLLDADRNVRASLDGRLQLLVARALRAHAEAESGRAAAVVLDAGSGDLLASASYPWPDAEDLDDNHGEEVIARERLLDRARYGLYPPGSTFKVVTAAAAFRTEPKAGESPFICVRLRDGRVGGQVHGVSRPIRDDPLDHVPHGTLDLHRALVVSCNAYFADLAERLGPRALGDTASAAQIAVAAPPVERNLSLTLAHAGYGQGQVVASPLRMARILAAVANGGVLRDVRLTITRPAPESEGTRWISAPAAELLRRYLREAVTAGTGRSLAGHPGMIAGKTGTAEVDGGRSHSWFVGFAPYTTSGRKIAFAVVVENAGYGARAAAPLAGEIVSAARAAGVIQ